MLPYDRSKEALNEMQARTRSSADVAPVVQTQAASPSVSNDANGKRKSMEDDAAAFLQSLLTTGEEEKEQEEEEEEVERKKQRKEEKGKEKETVKEDSEDEYESDLSESEDDETTELTEEARLALLERKTRKRLPKYRERPEKVNLQAEGHRKVKAAIRVKANEKRARIKIGTQRHRLEPGTGYKVDAGGNQDTRPKGVKEPSADYQKFFEQMKEMGKDPNAKKLYKKATGNDLADKDKLGDAEIAEIMLYYLKGNAGEIEQELGETSQLSVHLSKITAIFELAERSRSFEAENPYDAVDLIKGVLASVKDGKHSLEEGFYKGTGGSESIFVGAPSGKHAEDKIGGATVLRNMRDYPERLQRQMNVFPKNKGAFKKFVNGMRGKRLKKEDYAATAEEIAQLEDERNAEAPASKRKREDGDASSASTKKRPEKRKKTEHAGDSKAKRKRVTTRKRATKRTPTGTSTTATTPRKGKTAGGKTKRLKTGTETDHH